MAQKGGLQNKQRSSHEIPNPQVREAADQFQQGFKLMIEQVPGTGVLLPALHCASIALELYLKSLSAREVEKPSPIGDWMYIHAAAPAKSHKLENLFDEAPTDIQQLLEQAGGQLERVHRLGGVRKVLETLNSMFMASRYPYEPDRALENVEIYTLEELLLVFRNVIHKAPSRWLQMP